MAAQNFRSAFRGFNREDVVNYIEYLNNQHNIKLEQLNAQLQLAQDNREDEQLRAQLAEALARCEELEKQLADGNGYCSEQELEAYRRAEKAERQAQARAQQIYTQANAALADATAKAEVAAQRIGAIADEAVAQLKVCQASVLETKEDFQQAVSALYAVKPDEE